MVSRGSPTIRLLAGLAVTLTAVAVYSGYTIDQFRALRKLQTETIDRNRMDSLLLLRIQNNLNSLDLAMRDMLDGGEPYPLSSWRGQFKRIRLDLEDALRREDKTSGANRDQRQYLARSVAQFWDSLERVFALADNGAEKEARTQIRLSLQARHAALSSTVARLLVQNNESEQQAALETQRIYARVERNLYLFIAGILLVVVVTSLYLVQYNRRMFEQVASLSDRRSELAQQLISIQENTFRYISRELHDEFGQILTAIGAMLQRAHRRAAAADSALEGDLEEVREIVQSTLEKIRALSQALHPVVLDDAGLEGALSVYLPGFERQTGLEIHYEKEGASLELTRERSIHFYRIVQEALNNVARHSQSKRAHVRLRYSTDSVVLEVEDEGVGFKKAQNRSGMGLTSMRERAELVHGRIEFLDRNGGGSLVRLTAPVNVEETHAGA